MIADLIRAARMTAQEEPVAYGDPLLDAMMRDIACEPAAPRFGWVRACTNVAWSNGMSVTLDPSLDALIDRLADLVMER